MLKNIPVVLILAVVFVSEAAAQPSWGEPVILDTAANDSRYSNPIIASGHDGKMAAAWLSHSGTTTGTTFGLHLPMKRNADVFAAFSDDYGQSWSQPVQMSDPELLNTEVDLEAAGNGDFHFAWTSGDALSGYRLHTALTTDGGNTFTSATRLQGYMDSHQAFLYTDIEMAGANKVVAYTAFNQNKLIQPYERYLTTQSSDLTQWGDTHVIDSPVSETDSLAFDRHMASDGGTVIAVGSINNQPNYYSAAPRPVMVKSTNSGLTWSEPEFFTTATLYSIRPSIAADGNGNWVVMYFGTPYFGSGVFSSGRLHIQRSFDAGDTWTAPSQTSTSKWMYTQTPLSIAGDGAGRWLAVAENYYTWSNDNGETWSDLVEIPSMPRYWGSSECCYLGDGKWAVVDCGYFYPRGSEVRVIPLSWGHTAVLDWTLY